MKRFLDGFPVNANHIMPNDSMQTFSFPIPEDAFSLVMRACFDSTVSVFWGAPDGKFGMNSASGVLLKLKCPLLLTAEHVIRSFLERRVIEPSLRLQIAGGSIDDLPERIIGRSKHPDLATVNLTGIENKLFASHLIFHVPSKWPPVHVAVGLSVFIVGFPMAYRDVMQQQHAIRFDSFNLHTQVTSVSDHDFTCVIDASRMTNRSRHVTWPQSYGGISGCPVFAIRGTPSVLELVGIVYEASDNWSIIKAHHAQILSIDGTFPAQAASGPPKHGNDFLSA